MIDLHRWQTGPALVISLGIVSSAIVPFTLPLPATATSPPDTLAQLFPQPGTSRQVTIPAGTRIPVRYDEAKKIVVLPTETNPLTLTVARNVRNTYGTLLIPAGSQVKGELRPADGGSQFHAQELLLPDGTNLPIDATSDVVTKTQEVRKGGSTQILTGTAIGAGAAAILFGLTGRRRLNVGKVLAGAGLGALGGWLLGKQTVDVVVIDPNSDLTLTLNSDLVLR
ncbi:hypothetical protein K9N68_33685 [Kovacikia minuta CCNUW1]|uniref:hypothetical protein n=1 Tax=Kovacikia minuta TaxID=2931930 RepID=UPI001CCBD291|nr:hypothetical protein [Kovacikia minuta]UBF26396.1 hypothetical protein K9N68_33685 [Kovacikia minuta CCNUW1]